MTKIIKAKYKISRKLRSNVWESDKNTYAKRNYGPGQHAKSKSAKASDYGQHLRAKQLLKAHYGRITESQFRSLFYKARKMKGNSAVNFVGLLESRIDAIVYRLNLAPTIFAARQLVSHKHVKLNGKVVNIASITVKPGDKVEVVENYSGRSVIAESLNKIRRNVPDYLSLDKDEVSGKLIKLPDEISSVPYPFEPDVSLIVELYSR